MYEIECPYCRWAQEIDTENREDGDMVEQECNNCDKSFITSMQLSVDYKVYKADCLNTGEHLWSPTHALPAEAIRMRCIGCGATRNLTPEELTKIRHERKI